MSAQLCMEASVAPQTTLENAFTCPTVIHFSALLNVPEVQALHTSNPALFKLALIFAYGTVENLESEIPAAWLHKLRQLSLISYATQNRRLSYGDLLERLKLTSTRELEDVVIDAIYSGMVKGRIDSSNRVVLIDDWTSRDVPNPMEVVPQLSVVLDSWLKHAHETQFEALQKAEKENMFMNDDVEYRNRMKQDVQETRQNIEEMMSRSHEVGPSTSETTPRNKRRGALPNRPGKK